MTAVLLVDSMVVHLVVGMAVQKVAWTDVHWVVQWAGCWVALSVGCSVVQKDETRAAHWVERWVERSVLH